MIGKKRKIIFFYPVDTFLTGQELAARIILKIFKDSEYQFQLVKIPGFNKEKIFFLAYIEFFFKLIRQYCQWLKCFFLKSSVIYLNPGQSSVAIIREWLPYLLLALLRPGHKAVISLHGAFFQRWAVNSWRSRLFCRVLNRAAIVTCLYEKQSSHLKKIGVNTDIRIVPNTCENDEYSKPEENSTVSILFLSNLIQSKGYMRYINALRILAARELPLAVDAVLCGRYIEGVEHGSSENVPAAKELSGIIEEINSRYLSVAWLKNGAYGEDKLSLLRKTDIFVFPSMVDAQPIAVIEAMASSCALITSNVGGLPYMFTAEAGICLDDCSPENIAEEIMQLVNDRKRMYCMQLMARKQFDEFYSHRAHRKYWDKIFETLFDKLF